MTRPIDEVMRQMQEGGPDVGTAAATRIFRPAAYPAPPRLGMKEEKLRAQFRKQAEERYTLRALDERAGRPGVGFERLLEHLPIGPGGEDLGLAGRDAALLNLHRTDRGLQDQLKWQLIDEALKRVGLRRGGGEGGEMEDIG